MSACVWCKAPITQHYTGPTKKYCCQKCKDAAYRRPTVPITVTVMLKCGECGMEMPPNAKGLEKRYCSRFCRVRAQKRRNKMKPRRISAGSGG